MTKNDLQNLLRTGIQTAQSGNHAAAKTILRQVVEQDSNNELAWLWLASVETTLEDRQACLERVLAINPNNERARKALDQLISQTPAAPAPAKTQNMQLGAPAVRSGSTPRIAPRMDREALLAADPPPGRSFSRILFGIVGILATILIILGAYLMWFASQKKENDSSDGVAQATQAPTATAAITVMPTAPRDIVDAGKPLPATWTPEATWAPPTAAAPSVTPVPLDSYTLLFAGMRGYDFVWNLYTVSGNGSDETEVSIRLGEEDMEGYALVDVYEPTISPSGDMIAFSARFVPVQDEETSEAGGSGFQEICIAPVRGGTIRCVTAYGVLGTGAPAWSPDGTQLAFESNFDGDYDIYVIPVDGGRPTALTRNDMEDREPAWSPDGAYIAYASDEGGPGFLEVWRMTDLGADRVQLTDAANNSFSPAWSPDGEHIAFISDRNVDTDLFVMNADGSGERILTINDEAASDRDPSWSPDGRWIAFSSRLEGAAFNIFFIRADGRERQLIRMGNGDSRFTTWLP